MGEHNLGQPKFYVQNVGAALTYEQTFILWRMAETDLCDVQLVDQDAVQAAFADQADDDEITYLADTFQVLANPTRLRLVEALSQRELCVCDLAAVTGVSQSAVSHHLRQLRQLRIVRYRKAGRMAYYRLDDDHVATLLQTGIDHVRE